jgi:hypothetical protein
LKRLSYERKSRREKKRKRKRNNAKPKAVKVFACYGGWRMGGEGERRRKKNEKEMKKRSKRTPSLLRLRNQQFCEHRCKLNGTRLAKSLAFEKCRSAGAPSLTSEIVFDITSINSINSDSRWPGAFDRGSCCCPSPIIV